MPQEQWCPLGAAAAPAGLQEAPVRAGCRGRSRGQRAPSGGCAAALPGQGAGHVSAELSLICKGKCLPKIPTSRVRQ